MAHVKCLDFLKNHSIDFELYQHVSVFTTSESEKIKQDIPGAHSKNLFLKDKKKNYVLLSVLDTKKVDLTAFSKSYGKGRFSFASDEDLMYFLGVIPGSVTPYGLLNDIARNVIFYLDQDFLKSDHVNFHPLRNDMTLNVSTYDFLKFCEIVNHPPICVEIIEKIEST
ncbi:MAG: prolyl-tRNA synthetase associated domain-containing protein [Alphaproteobacteria bacterium]|nr:prolyl-tRNA synthetase associated domain-containing protein [Alphaproteobacteria bacterium]